MYIGVTSDLVKRVFEHKAKVVPSFTREYDLDRLVYFEDVDDYNSALAHEKQLKNWHRDWKINLIESVNPFWKDLYKDISQ